jgi:hypothetical protein
MRAIGGTESLHKGCNHSDAVGEGKRVMRPVEDPMGHLLMVGTGLNECNRGGYFGILVHLSGTPILLSDAAEGNCPAKRGRAIYRHHSVATEHVQ